MRFLIVVVLMSQFGTLVEASAPKKPVDAVQWFAYKFADRMKCDMALDKGFLFAEGRLVLSTSYVSGGDARRGTQKCNEAIEMASLWKTPLYVSSKGCVTPNLTRVADYCPN